MNCVTLVSDFFVVSESYTVELELLSLRELAELDIVHFLVCIEM